MDIAFQTGISLKFHGFFFVLFRQGPNSVSFLRLSCLSEFFFAFQSFFFDLPKTFPELIFCHDQLCGRIYGKRFQLLNGTLTLYVETADGVHFLAPKFYTIRIFFRQVKNIHNSAPHGKLSGKFHLRCFFISHGSQAQCQRLLIHQRRFVQRQHPFFYDRKRHLRCHKRSESGDNSNCTVFQQSAQHLHSFFYQLISVYIRLIKYQILPRIQQCISVIKPKFLTDFPCLQITVCDDQPMRIFSSHPINQMQLL